MQPDRSSIHWFTPQICPTARTLNLLCVQPHSELPARVHRSRNLHWTHRLEPSPPVQDAGVRVLSSLLCQMPTLKSHLESLGKLLSSLLSSFQNSVALYELFLLMKDLM